MRIGGKEMNEKKTMDYRFLARIVLEAETPLSVKSGGKDVYTDAVVMKDVNGLPYIPGSSLAGVIRHAWNNLGKDEKDFFGFQGQGKDGQGSRIIFSEARILNSKGIVMDGLCIDACKDDLLKWYEDLPVRQHVRINDLGVAVDAGKFDEQVVFAGTRFCFEMEMLGTENEKEEFENLIKILYESTFRLGSGTRNGFGKIKVVSVRYIEMGIIDSRYLTKSSNLEDCKMWWDTQGVKEFHGLSGHSGWEKYKLELMPEDFFLFGSGFGDDEADMVPVKERKVKWTDNAGTLQGTMEDYSYLLPASSIKGAIAHRVAFHYNKLTKTFADDFKGKEKEMETHVGKKNIAVYFLFGSDGPEDRNKLRGNVILSDLFVSGEDGKEKIINHVAIDRFTGGAIDGALFSEKAVYYDKRKQSLQLNIILNKKNVERQIASQENLKNKEKLLDNVIKTLENTLDDICKGRLPLGGQVNRGYGIFSGKKEKEE